MNKCSLTACETRLENFLDVQISGSTLIGDSYSGSLA